MKVQSKRLRGYFSLIVLLAAVGALVFAFRFSEFGQALELKTLDGRFRLLSAPERHDPSIVLVMVDQSSLDHFEKEHVYWPWPRSLYAAVLNYLKAGGARAVVFDVLFTSPSPIGQSEDVAFAKAVKNFGPVVMAMETGSKADALRAKAPPERFAVRVGSTLAGSAGVRRSARLPVPEIAKASLLLGDVKVKTDFDGINRRVPLVVSMDGRFYPTLPAAAAMAASGKTVEDFNAPLAGGGMLVRFHGKSLTDDPRWKTYDSYQIGDLLLSWQALEEKRRPALAPEVFKDKIVFIGLSAAGLLDNRPSPIAPVFAGTDIVATATDNLLHGDYLRASPPSAAVFLIITALVLAAIASRLASRTSIALGFMLASSGALAAVAAAAFSKGVWLEAAAPQLALWFGFAAASAYAYAVEGRQTRYIQAAFSQYLSPEIVSRIAANPDMLTLGGERRDVTFYFSDIQGFTTFSEQLTPEKLTRLMNRYLGEMTDTILSSGGTLDKYIGDAIMAFWGAPAPCDDHALVACKAALSNQRRLAGLREEFEREGYPPVRNRIGLNSGPASIGNMGSAARLSYTAIGDNVNLASRLEGANKAYGTYILISESTRQGAADAIEVRELDFVKVKGKNLPIRVYELLGLKGETDEGLLRKARRFEEGLARYRARAFKEAAAVFQAVINEFAQDHACEVYLERCRLCLETEPPADWDGSHALTEK
ncbi:MAG: adenylate/guanylate cyclase domain-containing protein [Elusimicrobiota bacterium]